MAYNFVLTSITTTLYHLIQGALMQLIEYYQRFTKLLSQHPFKELGFKGDLINIHHVMVEVKKYRANFNGNNIAS